MKASELKKISKLETRYTEQSWEQTKLCKLIEDEADDRYSVFSINPIWLKAKKNITALQRRIQKQRNKLAFDIKRLNEKDVKGFDEL